MKAQRKKTEHGERCHGDTQTLERGADVGVRGEIARLRVMRIGLTRSRQRARDAGKTGLRKSGHGAFLRTRCPFDDGKLGIADGGREFGGVLNSSIVKGAGARAELVFIVGGGDGNAALDFGEALCGSWGRSRVR